MLASLNQTGWSDLLFAYRQSKKTQWVIVLCLTIFFFGGMALWGVFLDWGRSPLNFHDWSAITGPRLVFLQNAVTNGALPLHISDSLPLDAATDRFMAVPDIILSPQILLLAFLSTDAFILVNTWLLYAAGFWGLLWLRKKFRLSLAAFTIFFFIFNFNGHILAHYTVGHFTWGAYFLYPWFIGLIFDLLEGRGNWAWTLKTSAWMLLVSLNGGYHHYVWALFFMALLAVICYRHFWLLLKTALFSVALCAVRVLPLFLPLGEFDNIFIGGFPLVNSIWESLVDIQIPNDITLNAGMTRPIGLWEFTLYVGLLGAFFLLYFGVYRVIKNAGEENAHPELLIPTAGLVILSMGKVYQYLRIALPVPIITGERVAARMIILGFLFVLALAVIELQRALDRKVPHPAIKFLSLVLALLISNDLWQNFRFWRIRDAAKAFEIKPFDAAKYTLANYPDPEYFTMLWIGLIVSAASLVLLVYFARREKEKIRPETHEKISKPPASAL